MTHKIFLGGKRGAGLFTLVDEEDYDRLSLYSWSLSAGGYAQARANGTCVLLHWLLTSKVAGTCIDHINGNKLDNQKINLRRATQSQNQQNRKLSDSTGLKGVSFHTGAQKWLSQISCATDGGHIYLGLFVDPEGAARAYDVKAIELFGEFARTNFPLTDYL